MLEARLTARVPSARFETTGILRSHALTFDKRGTDGSGKGNVRPASPSDAVHGVVYTIADAEMPDLDGFEGGYARRMTTIRIDGRPQTAACYFAGGDATDPSLRPFDWYLALVVAGARQHGLPDAYCRTLEGVETVVDTDPERRGAALETLGEYRKPFETGLLLGGD
jgi:hypothetical protein